MFLLETGIKKVILPGVTFCVIYHELITELSNDLSSGRIECEDGESGSVGKHGMMGW